MRIAGFDDPDDGDLYCLASGFTEQELRRDVNLLMRLGWRPQGGVCIGVFQYFDKEDKEEPDFSIMYQAMIRDAPASKD